MYSENAAHAHVRAARSLWPGSAAAGQSYFVCDHYPAENLFDFMAPFLRDLGLPVPTRAIPYRLAYAMATAAEIFAPHSNFNRFAVIQTCVDHTFVDLKAQRDLGYRPIVSREDAFARSMAWLRDGGAPARRAWGAVVQRFRRRLLQVRVPAEHLLRGHARAGHEKHHARIQEHPESLLEE